jgi:hypothetical protein
MCTKAIEEEIRKLFFLILNTEMWLNAHTEGGYYLQIF